MWIPMGTNGYLSGSIDDGWYKTTWMTGETRTITPFLSGSVVLQQKRCFNKDGTEKVCSNKLLPDFPFQS